MKNIKKEKNNFTKKFIACIEENFITTIIKAVVIKVIYHRLDDVLCNKGMERGLMICNTC